MIYFIIAFIACFIGYLFHTITHYAESKNKKLRIPHSVFEMLITIGWIGWGFMLYLDPWNIDLPLYILIIAVIAAFIGGLIGLLGFKEKKGFGEEDKLITKGIYSKFRHPMYVSLILMHLALPLIFGALLTFLSSILWVPQILLWKHWEDKELAKRFGKEYLAYKRKTIF
jgi:protein-S-isoprenylcysteine O-methyltransferase Ste14